MNNIFSQGLTKNFNFFVSEDFVSKYKNEIIETLREVESLQDLSKCIISSYNALTLIIKDIIEKNSHIFRNKIDIDKTNLSEKIKFIRDESGPDTSDYIYSIMYEIKNARNYESHKYDKTKVLDIKWTKYDVIVSLQKIFVICKHFYSDIVKQKIFDATYYEKGIGGSSIEAIDEETRNKSKNEYLSMMSLKINGDTIGNWLGIKNSKLIVPIYQRAYKWNSQNIEILLNDILDRMNDDGEHYFGTIAQKKQLGEKNNDPNIIKIIDGQQRLTTSLLIIRAASNVLVDKFNKKIEEIDWYKDITNQHCNPRKLGDYIYNPGCNAKENEIFRRILNNEIALDEIEKTKSLYAENYLKIYNFIVNKFETNYDITMFIYVFLNKFNVASINFDQEKFSNKKEMEIFENLNSKGLELNNVDLIKNHLFNYCNDETLNKKDNEIIIPQEYSIAISEFNNKDEEIESFYLTLAEFYNGDEISSDKRVRFSAIRESIDKYLKDYKDIKNFNDYQQMIKHLRKYINLYNETIMGNYNFLKFIKCYDAINIITDKKKKRLFSYFVFIVFNVITQKNEYDFNDCNNQKISLNNENIKVIQSMFLEICKFLIKTKVITKQGDSNIKRSLLAIANKNLDISQDPNTSIQFICKKIIDEINELNNIEKYSFTNFKESLKNNTNHNSIIELFILTEKIMSKSLFNENESVSRPNQSIEHILPKEWIEWANEIENAEERKNFEIKADEYKEKIGNYLILTTKQNSKNKNFIFKDKKEKVFNDLISPLYINKNEDIDISKKSKWTFEDIDKRTNALIEYITKNVITQ